MEEEDIPIRVGDIVKDSYKLIHLIAQEERGAIFCALDTQMKQVAIKFELDSKKQTSICVEAAILKLLDGSNHIPQFYQYGIHLNYKFLALELMGPNMIDLINYKKPYKFSLHSILKFGIQAIETLQFVHNKGFVHRDIKPGNFLIGNSPDTINLFKLTDFGLCKKIHKYDDVVVKPTNKGSFRGALLYASLNAHKLVELGRNDDLMSLLYILVEFHNGMLPWSGVEDAKTLILKEHYHGHKLLKWLPKQFLEFESHIISLDYTTDPDYAYLISLLKQAADENKIDLKSPFEWEEDMNNERDKIMKFHTKQSQKIEQKIKDLENEKKRIIEENNQDNQQKLAQLDKQINDQKELTPSQYQLEVKLNSLNTIHRLQKKNDQIYKQEEEEYKQQMHTSENKPNHKVIQSHIHAVKSFHYNSELPGNISERQVSFSPLDFPLHTQSNNLNNQHESPKQHLRGKSPNQSHPGADNGTNTVQELLTIIDALIGVDSKTDQGTNESTLPIEGTRYESRINYVEQFMNEMKQKDNYTIGNSWNSFIGSIRGSNVSQLFEPFDLMSSTDVLSECISNPFNEQQQQQLLSQLSNNAQQTRTNSEFDLQLTLSSSPILKINSQQSPIYSPLTFTPNEQSPKNSPVIVSPTPISPIDRQLSPQLLESKVLPITEVIHNQPGQSRTHKTLIANMNINKQSQNLFQQQMQELESIPTTPIDTLLSEEIRQWNLSTDSQKSAQRYMKQLTDNQFGEGIDFQESEGLFIKGSHSNKDANQLSNRMKHKYIIKTSSLTKQGSDQEQEQEQDDDDDDEQEIFKINSNQELDQQIAQMNQNNIQMRLSAVVLQQLQLDGESSQILNKNETQINNDKPDDNVQSPFSIRISRYSDKSNTIPTYDNLENQLLSLSHMDCNLQIEQSLQYSNNLTIQQDIAAQTLNKSPLNNSIINSPQLSQNNQQHNKPHLDVIIYDSNLNTQFMTNTSSNNQITPLSLLNEKHSPLFSEHSAWEVEDENEKGQKLQKEQDQEHQNQQQKGQNKQQEQIKEQKQDKMIIENQNIPNINLQTNHNVQPEAYDNNANIELKVINDKSCCTIL